MHFAGPPLEHCQPPDTEAYCLHSEMEVAVVGRVYILHSSINVHLGPGWPPRIQGEASQIIDPSGIWEVLVCK